MSTATSVATILENTTTLGTLVTSVWGFMTANPLLLVFLCASLVSLGFSLYRKAKGAVRK